ncbi:MAG: hypothetical protein ACREPB_12820, partial [Arenimonas sp.]
LKVESGAKQRGQVDKSAIVLPAPPRLTLKGGKTRTYMDAPSVTRGSFDVVLGGRKTRTATKPTSPDTGLRFSLQGLLVNIENGYFCGGFYLPTAVNA